MTRKILLGVVVALVLVSTGAMAQDYFNPLFGFHTDSLVPEVSPCGAVGIAGNVAPVVYDSSLVLVYTCNDGRVIGRRFFRPNDHNDAPPVTVAPAATVRCTVPGMVTSINGGCVPPNHPLAPK